jgi:hypothetical protein
MSGLIKVHGMVIRAPAEASHAAAVETAKMLLNVARKRYPNEHLQVEIGGVPYAGYYRSAG